MTAGPACRGSFTKPRFCKRSSKRVMSGSRAIMRSHGRCRDTVLSCAPQDAERIVLRAVSPNAFSFASTRDWSWSAVRKIER